MLDDPEQVIAGQQVAFVDRQVVGQPQGPASGDDGDLVHRVGTGNQFADDGVTRFVVGDPLLLFISDHHAAPLGPHHDLVLGLLHVDHGHFVAVEAGGQKGALIDQVGQVGPRETGGGPGQDGQIDIFGQGDIAGVHPEDPFATLHVGQIDHHLAVEAARSQQGRVEHVGAVGGRDQDHPVVGFETVHLDQELVEGLLALVVAPSQTGAAVAADGIEFVDEDDAGRVLLALLEQVAHPAGPHADEHLHEIGPGEAEEGHPRFTGHRPRQQGLARSRRAEQEHALGNAAPQALEFCGVFQKLDDLFEFLLGFIGPGHIVEGDLHLAPGEQAGPALAEAEHPPLPPLHLPHDEEPDGQNQDPGQDTDQVVGPGTGLLLEGVLDIFSVPVLQQLDVDDPLGQHQGEVAEGAGLPADLAQDGGAHPAGDHGVALDGDRGHILALYHFGEFGVGDLDLVPAPRTVEHTHDHDSAEEDDGPDEEHAGEIAPALERILAAVSGAVPAVAGPWGRGDLVAPAVHIAHCLTSRDHPRADRRV